jgi:hypothetical protein
MEMAGEIESIGREVKQFEKGDEVFGMTDFGGGYAEYVCIPEAELPKKVMGAKKAQRTRRYPPKWREAATEKTEKGVIRVTSPRVKEFKSHPRSKV